MQYQELCTNCPRREQFIAHPELIEAPLGRLAAAGFRCAQPHNEPNDPNPFVRYPRSRRFCGLDYELKRAIEAVGLVDTETNSDARLSFFYGTLELHPVKT